MKLNTRIEVTRRGRITHCCQAMHRVGARRECVCRGGVRDRPPSSITRDIRGHCDISTSFDDDRACNPAPRVEQGLQVHIGPANYEDPAEFTKFIMKPGDESSECFTLRTPNTELVTYQTAVLSGRAGTHHIINTLYEGDLPTATSVAATVARAVRRRRSAQCPARRI